MRAQTALTIALLGLPAIACMPSAAEDVAIKVNDDVTLACTLSIPADEAPLPAVILIPGGGPHTRDVDVFGFQLFRETARHLTARGIATLRCDKRGFGRTIASHGPGETTTLDLADDVLAQVAYLRRRPEIDSRRLGLLGMSEGATVATMVDARSDDVEFVILAAAPALLPRQVAHGQVEVALRRGGM